MMKDNLKDIEEELIDATFNALVFSFRLSKKHPYGAKEILRTLQNIWSYVQQVKREMYAMGQ